MLKVLCAFIALVFVGVGQEIQTQAALPKTQIYEIAIMTSSNSLAVETTFKNEITAAWAKMGANQNSLYQQMFNKTVASLAAGEWAVEQDRPSTMLQIKSFADLRFSITMADTDRTRYDKWATWMNKRLERFSPGTPTEDGFALLFVTALTAQQMAELLTGGAPDKYPGLALPRQ